MRLWFSGMTLVSQANYSGSNPGSRIGVFEIFGQMVRKETYHIFAEVGESYIQNMSYMYLQYKYNIPEMCKTANSTSQLRQYICWQVLHTIHFFYILQKPN